MRKLSAINVGLAHNDYDIYRKMMPDKKVKRSLKDSSGYLEFSESTEPNDESVNKAHRKPEGKKYDRGKRLVKSLGKANSCPLVTKPYLSKTEHKANLTKAESEDNLKIAGREANLTTAEREANLTTAERTSNSMIAGRKVALTRNK